jgi:hypothetical protein
MVVMNKRFQRFALISEAARLESYLNQQLDLTYTQLNELDVPPGSKVADRLQYRYDQLGKCREKANELRGMIWNLD